MKQIIHISALFFWYYTLYTFLIDKFKDIFVMKEDYQTFLSFNQSLTIFIILTIITIILRWNDYKWIIKIQKKSF